MPSKLTIDQVEDKLKLNNVSVIIVSEYNGNSKVSDFKCLICDNIWSVRPKDVISGRSGCPECGRIKSKNTPKYKINTESFTKKINDLHPYKINVIGTYISSGSRIKVECIICKNVWEPEAKRLISGESSCKKCSDSKTGLKIRKSHVEFTDQIKDIYGDKISILSNYTTCLDKVDVMCNICGHNWSTISRSLLRRSCPKCNFSKGELLISSILNKIGIKFKEQYIFSGLKTKNNGTPKFDFVIFDGDRVSKVIEYDGLQHFKSVKKWGGENRLEQQIKIDKFKDEFCILSGIDIIRIPYTDYNKIDADYLTKLLGYI